MAEMPSEKTGNGGSKAGVTPAPAGVTTGKVSDESAQQATRKWGWRQDRDGKNEAEVQPKPPPPPPPPSSSSMMPPPPPPAKKPAKKKDIRVIRDSFFVHHWLTALAILTKHCFLLRIC